MKTIFLKKEDIPRKWYLIDARDKTLGRLATKVVTLLRGKTKAAFTPNQEMGDYIVIVNADQVRVTGRKTSDKLYYRHSGYPSGLKSETYSQVIARKPTYPLEHAIKGMLPKNRLGRKLFNNVKIYAGESHPHAAQKPEKIEF
jgi:large subunit ribosomal protein L13